MNVLTKLFYAGALLTTVMHAPSTLASVIINNAPTASYEMSASYGYDNQPGMNMICGQLRSIQQNSFSAGNEIEAGAVGFYRSLVGNAGSNAGYKGNC